MFGRKDTLLKVTRALPAAASATVNSTAIDLGHSTKGDFLANSELKISAPAVNTTMAPDTRTFTYHVVHHDTSDLSSGSILQTGIIVQTGAASAGAAAAEAVMRLPVDVKRFVGVRVVSGASTTDASAVSATVEVLN